MRIGLSISRLHLPLTDSLNLHIYQLVFLLIVYVLLSLIILFPSILFFYSFVSHPLEPFNLFDLG